MNKDSLKTKATMKTIVDEFKESTDIIRKIDINVGEGTITLPPKQSYREGTQVTQIGELAKITAEYGFYFTVDPVAYGGKITIPALATSE